MDICASEKVEELGRNQGVSFSGIDCIPEPIRQLLEKDWERHRVLKFFLESSEICRILHKNPADWEMLEITYFGKSVRGTANLNGLDTWLGNSLSGQALRNRLAVTSSLVVKLLENRLTAGGSIRVVDLGSGPGPYAIEVVGKLPKKLQRTLSWECIDLDQLALDLGEERVVEQGLERVINFHRANFMSRDSYPKSVADLAGFGLMVGILCSMTCEEAIQCLTKVKPHFRQGGELIAATLLEKSFREDAPIFRILCNVLGWQLRPKSMKEVEEVFRTAGYEIMGIHSERKDGDGQYAIVHAKLP